MQNSCVSFGPLSIHTLLGGGGGSGRSWGSWGRWWERRGGGGVAGLGGDLGAGGGGGGGGDSLEAWEEMVFFLEGFGEGHREDEGGGPPGAQVDRHIDPGMAILTV